MARKGYKKNFLKPQECAEFSRLIFQKMKTPWAQYDHGEITAPRLVAEFLLQGIQLIYPKNWISRRRTVRNPNHPALDFGFRAVPESAHLSLENWFLQNYDLVLFSEVPSVETVLSLQSLGKRCVSVIRDQQSLSSYILGERDPLSFTIHDLIHADHFLRDPHQKNVQIGFSRLMKELHHFAPIQESLISKAAFASQFEYAASDMNSHGAHLCKYLKAILIQNNLFEAILHFFERGESHQVLPGDQTDRLWQLFKDLSTPEESPQTLAELDHLLYFVAQVPFENSCNDINF